MVGVPRTFTDAGCESTLLVEPAISLSTDAVCRLVSMVEDLSEWSDMVIVINRDSRAAREAGGSGRKKMGIPALQAIAADT